MSIAQKEDNSRPRSSSLKGSGGSRPTNKHEGNADGNEGLLPPSDAKKQTTKAERRALQVVYTAEGLYTIGVPHTPNPPTGTHPPSPQRCPASP